eukprot:14352869-Alexandrium_andersonii.AAC.1
MPSAWDRRPVRKRGKKGLEVRLLARAPSKDQLRAVAWPDLALTAATLRNHVAVAAQRKPGVSHAAFPALPAATETKLEADAD